MYDTITDSPQYIPANKRDTIYRVTDPKICKQKYNAITESLSGKACITWAHGKRHNTISVNGHGPRPVLQKDH